MADNIKIVGEILNTQEIPRYNEEDVRLLSPILFKEDFGRPNDYIEYYIYDIENNLLNVNYNYKDFKSPSTSYVDPVNGSLPIIEIDPIKDLQNLGYSSGEFRVQYNLFNNIISDADQQGLFLKEISSDRTEIRVGSTILTNEQIESGSLNIINSYSGSSYFVDYIINFGNNIQAIAVNTALNKVESGYEILFKLYEPLPDDISEKVSLWVVKEKVNPYVFEINLDRLVIAAPGPKLKGPNFAIDIPNQNNIATSYQTYDSLVNSINNISSASYQQFLSLITSQSIDINTDYTNFSNFVFFSSAKKRVENFYNKVKDIEDYKTFITTYTPFVATTASLQNTINQATASINNIIANFDGFEYYLYFESSSTLISSLEYDITPYPKSSFTKPFILLPTSSNSVITWYNWATTNAEEYDDVNQNKLTFTVPTFIKDDENNEPYLNFLDMVGHYFDNIWIFLQAVTDINLANNNLEQGVSRDLVYYVLESLGTKLYNQYGNSDNLSYLIGNSGSINFDNNFTYTGSYLNSIPRKDLVAESYKRIYHNLPLLLKTKGTSYGLQTLISTFGLTSSLLPVKEYGGDLKSNTLDEFNNDKVRIVSSSIVSGSVLSPYISLLEYPTASSQFRINDQNYVDISFSPQDKIDIFTSASIVSTNPTWNIDDYIGDPRYLYSGSYGNLEIQRLLYLSPLSASLLPFTGSLGSGSLAATDYNSFIRLVQFFDNSLFKMLKDFVPARTSLSTGITISSPILERNKWSYANPSLTSKVEIETGSINMVSVGSEYTDLYNYLTESKVEYYNGNITGSYINTYNYFASYSFNPYLFLTSSLSSEDIYYFNHTEFNVLLNNVSKSLQSSNRRLLEPIYKMNSPISLAGFITRSFAELQDSYESLKTHQLSRYEGVKVSSLKYNNYTSASSTYVGDTSYGKTAAIDYNTYKVGWVKSIPSQSLNFYDKTSINLKYLVDAQNRLTELSRGNLNLPEVQRIFRSGDPVILSISDVKNPSNQTTLDGTKTIWKGGFSYDPILFRETNETLTFQFDKPISSSIGYIGVKGVSTDYFGFRKVEDNSKKSVQAPPSEPNNGGILYTYTKNGSKAEEGEIMAYNFFSQNIWNQTYGTYLNINFNPKVQGTAQVSQGQINNIRISTSGYAYAFNLTNFNKTASFGGYNTEPSSNTYVYLANDTYVYKVQRDAVYSIQGLIPFAIRGKNSQSNKVGSIGKTNLGIKVIGIVETTKEDPNIDSNWKPLFDNNGKLVATQLTSSPNLPINNVGVVEAGNLMLIYVSDTPFGWRSVYCKLPNNVDVSLTSGTYVRFQLYIVDCSNIFGAADGIGISHEFEFIINKAPNLPEKAFFEIYDKTNTITNYFYTSSYGQLPPLFITSSILTNTIIFDKSAQYLFDTSSIFLPSEPTSQYYSPVSDRFEIQKYDLFRFGRFTDPNPIYTEVSNIYVNNDQTYVTLNLLPTNSNATSFAIFRPKPDETSVIVNYRKQPGEVSQTILIPNDANDSIKNNVGNIFKNLNTQLI